MNRNNQDWIGEYNGFDDIPQHGALPGGCCYGSSYVTQKMDQLAELCDSCGAEVDVFWSPEKGRIIVRGSRADVAAAREAFRAFNQNIFQFLTED